ncbi:MAG TPA: hypothetical protein VF598_10475 [Hymenobacter sp.]
MHDVRGLELHRQCSGGLRLDWQRDAAGRPISQRVMAHQQPTRHRHYQWQGADQLAAIEDSLMGTPRSTTHSARSPAPITPMARRTLRLRDAGGNLFHSPTLDDRQYAPGGQLH